MLELCGSKVQGVYSQSFISWKSKHKSLTKKSYENIIWFEEWKWTWITTWKELIIIEKLWFSYMKKEGKNS